MKNKKWNELSMAERTQYLKLGIESGIYDPSVISERYNIMAEGGDKGSKNNKDTDETTDETYYGGSIKPAVITESLGDNDKESRNKWNRLYREGRVSLSQIPRKYQSWIEAENSDFKKNVSEGISRFGEQFAPVLAGAFVAPYAIAAAPAVGAALAPGTAGGTMAANMAVPILAGQSLDKISEQLTGNTIGQNARNLVASTTGFEGFKGDSVGADIGNFAYNTITDLANPGYWINPQKYITAVDDALKIGQKALKDAGNYLTAGKSGRQAMSKYNTKDKRLAFIRQFNDEMANVYGYDPIPESASFDEAKDLAKKIYERHNTVVRGTGDFMASPRLTDAEKAYYRNRMKQAGYNPDSETERVLYSNTHVSPLNEGYGRSDVDSHFISHMFNDTAGRDRGTLYTSNSLGTALDYTYNLDPSTVAVLRRNYNLGKNPFNWNKAADWESTTMHGYKVPDELVADYRKARTDKAKAKSVTRALNEEYKTTVNKYIEDYIASLDNSVPSDPLHEGIKKTLASRYNLGRPITLNSTMDYYYANYLAGHYPHNFIKPLREGKNDVFKHTVVDLGITVPYKSKAEFRSYMTAAIRHELKNLLGTNTGSDGIKAAKFLLKGHYPGYKDIIDKIDSPRFHDLYSKYDSAVRTKTEAFSKESKIFKEATSGYPDIPVTIELPGLNHYIFFDRLSKNQPTLQYIGDGTWFPDLQDYISGQHIITRQHYGESHPLLTKKFDIGGELFSVGDGTTAEDSQYNPFGLDPKYLIPFPQSEEEPLEEEPQEPTQHELNRSITNQDVVNSYIDNVVYTMENPRKTGYDDGVWKVYEDKDSNGVTHYNYGPGIESNSNAGARLDYKSDKGYSTEQLNEAMRPFLMKQMEDISADLHEMYGSDADTMSLGNRLILLDIAHNVRPRGSKRKNMPKSWKNLSDALMEGNTDAAKREMYSGSKRRSEMRSDLLWKNEVDSNTVKNR